MTTWVSSRKELIEIMDRDLRRLIERFERLHEEPERDDILRGMVQDCNAIADLSKQIINRHYRED
jgi:hypothetical protein